MAWISVNQMDYYRLKKEVLEEGGEYTDIEQIHGRVGELVIFHGIPTLKRVDHYIETVYYKNDTICGG